MSAPTEAAKAALEKKNDAPAEAAPPRKTIAELIEQQKDQIARALPSQMDPDRLARVALTVKANPDLLKCSSASLLAALMLSAQLGLEPGPLGHCYFVPFKNEVTFIVGYRGLIDLARRSGQITSIEAREVRPDDDFEFEYGLDGRLVHRPNLDQRGDPVAYYGVAKFKDGGYYFLVMSKADIERHRERSKAKSNGPWVTDYDAMARKTVIRAMAPYLPVSVEAARAIAQDETVHTTWSEDMADEMPPIDVNEVPS
jgi:recombination protein RecT